MFTPRAMRFSTARPDVHRPARRAENRAALLMNAIDELRRDLHRLDAARRIEPAVSAAKAEHLRDAVAVVQFEEERADDVVQPRTQPAARHDARARLLRIEEELRPRPRQLELQPRLRADFDPLRDADVVADRVAFRGGEARFAEGGCLHEKGLALKMPPRRARGPIGLWSYGD